MTNEEKLQHRIDLYEMTFRLIGNSECVTRCHMLAANAKDAADSAVARMSGEAPTDFFEAFGFDGGDTVIVADLDTGEVGATTVDEFRKDGER